MISLTWIIIATVTGKWILYTFYSSRLFLIEGLFLWQMDLAFFSFPEKFLSKFDTFYKTIYFIRFASIVYNGFEFYLYVQLFNQMFSEILVIE